jgi:hypothetical protein
MAPPGAVWGIGGQSANWHSEAAAQFVLLCVPNFYVSFHFMSTLRAMKNTIPIIMNARFFIVTFTTLFASLI